MAQKHPVEIVKRYSVCVDELADVWGFLMDHTDKVNKPRISVDPIWDANDEDHTVNADTNCHYAVVVEGVVFE